MIRKKKKLKPKVTKTNEQERRVKYKVSKPIIFLDDEDTLEGVDAIVSGWGSTFEKGPPSDVPMKVSLNLDNVLLRGFSDVSFWIFMVSTVA